MNPTHFGNPAGGCLDDEHDTSLNGTTLVVCAPECFTVLCPKDKPEGTDAEIKVYYPFPLCALFCKEDGSTTCPKGA